MSHPLGPAARSTARVPQSQIEGLFESGQSMAAVQIITGIVDSIDSDEQCSVLVDEALVSGVVYLDAAPPVGALVEIEIRGDLWVIRLMLDPNPFDEGQSAHAEHIVSSDTPDPPDPFEVQVGGSMRSEDAWVFFPPEDEVWTLEADASGTGLRVYQAAGSTAATLWSDLPFDVNSRDVLDITIDLQINAGAAGLADIVINFDPNENGEALPDGDVAEIAYGVGVLVDGAVQLIATCDVPDSITTPDTGVCKPVRARLGIVLSGDGTADMTITGVEVIQTPGAWPIGSVWFDPDADNGAVVTSQNSAQTATSPVSLPYSAAFTPVPAARKAVVTAPPGSGGVLLVFWHCTVTGGQGSGTPESLDFQLAWNAGTANSTPRMAQLGGAQTPVYLSSNFVFDPGEVKEIWVEYKYSANPGSGNLYALQFIQMQVVFLPGAIRSDADTGDPMVRYWDGDSWTPDVLQAASVDMTDDGTTPPPAKDPTTTVCTHSGGTVVAGQPVTLKAVVTDGSVVNGSVVFAKSASSGGPWSVLGTSTLFSGTATRTWHAARGTWYFQASYQGNENYLSSSDVSAALTVKAGKPPPTTKTVTLACSWVEAYDGDNDQLSGSGHDNGVNQGWYSATNGQLKSLARFSPSLPADAVVTQVDLLCSDWEHWYSYSGGTLVVGWHDSSTAPTRYPTTGTHEDQSRHAVATGSWTVTLGWAKDAVTRSDFKGLVFGSPGLGQSHGYYGYSASPGASQIRLRISYKTWT